MPSSRKSGWRLVAEQEVRVARADGTLLWSVAAAVVFATLLAGGIPYLTSSPWSASQTVLVVAPLLLLVLPIIAASNSYSSVNAPRQSGRLRTVLALPLSRRDVVVGTAVGQFVLTAASVVALVGTMTAFALVRPQPVDGLVAAAGVTVAAVALVAAFVGVAVGWSAATRTPPRALLGCLLVGGLLLQWWLPVHAVRFVLNGLAWPTTPIPSWLAWYGAFNPIDAYLGILDAVGFAVSGSSIGLLGFGVLLAWAVVPVAIGSVRFDAVDL